MDSWKVWRKWWLKCSEEEGKKISNRRTVMFESQVIRGRLVTSTVRSSSGQAYSVRGKRWAQTVSRAWKILQMSLLVFIQRAMGFYTGYRHDRVCVWERSLSWIVESGLIFSLLHFPKQRSQFWEADSGSHVKFPNFPNLIGSLSHLCMGFVIKCRLQ